MSRVKPMSALLRDRLKVLFRRGESPVWGEATSTGSRLTEKNSRRANLDRGVKV